MCSFVLAFPVFLIRICVGSRFDGIFCYFCQLADTKSTANCRNKSCFVLRSGSERIGTEEAVEKLLGLSYFRSNEEINLFYVFLILSRFCLTGVKVEAIPSTNRKLNMIFPLGRLLFEKLTDTEPQLAILTQEQPEKRKD